jgi:hypothetical protein
MGRGIRHSKNKKKKQQNQGERQQRQEADRGLGYKELVRANPLFESFYRAQVNKAL